MTPVATRKRTATPSRPAASRSAPRPGPKPVRARTPAVRRPGPAKPSSAGAPAAIYFESAEAWRRWLDRHHATVAAVWVGYHKRATQTPSMTWPESVDEALCYGWIDGVRKRIDDHRYVIRFTPRRPRSIWSSINIRRVEALIRDGRMLPPGRAAFEAREAARSGIYSFEQKPQALSAEYEARLRASRKAWAFFESQPPWYRRTSSFWVMSAKREETRLRRLETLIRDSAAGRRIGLLALSERK